MAATRATSSGAACANVRAPPGPGLGRSATSDPVGAWVATVTIRSCADPGVVVGGPFKAIVVFHAGGTLSEAAAPSAPRTPSFGTWSRTGKREFYAESVLRTFVGPTFSGTQEIRRRIRVAEDGASFVAATRTLVRNVDGLQQGVESCARGEAVRFE